MKGLDTGTIIALCAVFIVWFGVVYFLLDAKIGPVKENIAKLENRIEGLEKGQAEIKQMIKNNTHNIPKQANK